MGVKGLRETEYLVSELISQPRSVREIVGWKSENVEDGGRERNNS